MAGGGRFFLGFCAFCAFSGFQGFSEEKLFDGKSLAGWVVEGGKTARDGPVWVAQDGMITCKAGGGFGFLRHEKKVADFVLRLEYRFEAAKGKRGTSGVGFRTVPFDPKRATDTRPSSAAYEVELADDADRKPDRHSTGALSRLMAPSEQAAKAAPAWNTLEVECEGPMIRVRVNGKKVIDLDQSKVGALKGKPLAGYVSLRNHGSRVDFRDITLRPLPAKRGSP
ncbi:MAG: DUF1080 domain-containing protein [Gemmataceae bacterium]|nr:DUF1080 domain-containing protein [Gemmataceae bacterium]